VLLVFLLASASCRSLTTAIPFLIMDAHQASLPLAKRDALLPKRGYLASGHCPYFINFTNPGRRDSVHT
jgi:hypothetical protein